MDDKTSNQKYGLKDHEIVACLKGLVRTDDNGRRLVLLDNNTVYWRGHRSTYSDGRVKVLAGHRGCHFPAFVRYVGAGLLDAAIVGPDYERQPSVAHILKTIRELDDRRGVLVLVANETSARINYGLAAEKARSMGIIVKMLAVGDDVVRCRATDGDGSGRSFVRRRGAAGIVLLCKIAGAMSASGHTLVKIFAVCQRLCSDRIATVNALISKVRSYGNKDDDDRDDDIKHDENVLLLGVDTNGRNGIKTVRTTDIAETVSAVMDVLTTADHGYGDRLTFRDWRGTDVVAMVNNLGGMSDTTFMATVAELTVQLPVATEVRAVHRWYTGRMLSSAGHTNDGFSITLLNIGIADDDSDADRRVYEGTSPLIAYLDFPVFASGWTFTCFEGNCKLQQPSRYDHQFFEPLSDDDDDNYPQGPTLADDQVPFFKDVLQNVCKRIVEAEGLLNEMDAMDDGDCGSNWRRGAEALIAAMQMDCVNATSPSHAFRTIGRLMERLMAGTLGVLLSVFFRSFSLGFSMHTDPSPSTWLDALGQGVLSIKAYGQSQPGERTLLDALIPAVRGMEIILLESKNPINLLRRAVREANEGCKRTERDTTPLMADDDNNYRQRTPTADPGAYGVKIILQAILETYVQRLSQEIEKHQCFSV